MQIELGSMRNKILIIADKKVYSDSNREWIQVNCPETDVIEAASAEEALEKVDERAPKIILIFSGQDFQGEGAKHESIDRGRQLLLPAINP